METSSAAAIELVSDDQRLRVKFLWREDRFAQQLWVDDEAVGESIEGNSSDAWPLSPPLQQLSLEPIAGRLAVLGVGGAGRGHWSISAQACEDDPRAIQFDLACRNKATPEFLGSSYQMTESVVAVPLAADLSELPSSSPRQRPQDSPSGEPADWRGVQITPGRRDGGATFRWSYRLVAVESTV